MNADFDLAIVGSGFGGSLLAMIARQLGRSVVLIERGRHPRFAIGESSTPLANLLLEQLASRYDLPQVAAFAKWGLWQQTHPHIAAGLKRGFTFYHHQAGQPWRSDPERRNEMLVAASPHDAIADTHWYRPDFDAYLAGEAQRCGVEFLDETRLNAASISDHDVTLTGQRHGLPIRVRARFVVDATGPRGFLHRALDLPEQPLMPMPATQGLFTHFEGVRRWDDQQPSDEAPPYPVDDAAVHHVFEGGWIWVLRFNNGLTSAGVAAEESLARTLRFADGAPAWERLLARFPSIDTQFQKATATLPFMHSPQLPFRSGKAAGARWALLPSAAGFVDPLLSTGFPLTLLGIERLAAMLESHWETPALAEACRSYECQTFAELDTTAGLVAALYANLAEFETFRALTLLYFAAAMYAETMRRLGRSEHVNSFLLRDHPTFGPALHACARQARHSSEDKARVREAIATAIEPFNLAALGDPVRRHWYPCLASDLLAAAPKLGVGSPEIERLLARCGFSSMR